MYLTDREIRERLPAFNFTAEEGAPEFAPDSQIGPCSVDLRLSLVYWTSRRSRRRRPVVDLEQSRLMDLLPHRGWDRRRVKFGEKLTLKPGEMILGRISESFSLPADCAGAIEGRSSYARLGLSVHASGGFINPGWRGHMPLTLVNHSANTIRIPVGTPLCQLMIIGLSGPAEADYAARTDRKYPNDTGGPSYWWRDKLFREIREAVAKTNLPANVFDELDELVGNWDDEQILERLERFISEASHGTFGNADELLDGFSKAEDRHEARGKRKDFATQWSWAVFTTIAVAVAFISFPGWIKVVLGLVAILSVVLAVASVGQPQSDFLTTAKLAGLRSRRDSPRPP